MSYFLPMSRSATVSARYLDDRSIAYACQETNELLMEVTKQFGQHGVETTCQPNDPIVEWAKLNRNNFDYLHEYYCEVMGMHYRRSGMRHHCHGQFKDRWSYNVRDMIPRGNRNGQIEFINNAKSGSIDLRFIDDVFAANKMFLRQLYILDNRMPEWYGRKREWDRVVSFAEDFNDFDDFYAEGIQIQAGEPLEMPRLERPRAQLREGNTFRVPEPGTYTIAATPAQPNDWIGTITGNPWINPVILGQEHGLTIPVEANTIRGFNTDHVVLDETVHARAYAEFNEARLDQARAEIQQTFTRDTLDRARAEMEELERVATYIAPPIPRRR